MRRGVRRCHRARRQSDEPIGLPAEADRGGADHDEDHAGEVRERRPGCRPARRTGRRRATAPDAVVIPPTNTNSTMTRLLTGSNWLSCTDAGLAAEEPAGAPGDERRQGEDHELDGPHPHAQRRGGELAVTHRGELPTEPAASTDADRRWPGRRTPTVHQTANDRVGCGGPAEDGGSSHRDAAEPEDPRVTQDRLAPDRATPNVLSARWRPAKADGRAAPRPPRRPRRRVRRAACPRRSPRRRSWR